MTTPGAAVAAEAAAVEATTGAPPTGGGWAARQLRAFLTGMMFLTRIPCPAWVGYHPDYLAWSTTWFPVIGAVVGAFGAGVFALASAGLPPFVAATLATAATVWLTGAFHEDALADSCDGFGGGWERDQVLAIMKDSRVGSYAVVGVALALATRIGALATMGGPDAAARALVAAHVLGRWSSLPLIWHQPYVRETGSKSRPFAASVTPARLVVGTLLAVALSAAVLGTRALPALGAAMVVTLVAGRYFRRRLGGITGDCLGAANQLVEIAVYLVLAWRWRGWGA